MRTKPFPFQNRLFMTYAAVVVVVVVLFTAVLFLMTTDMNRRTERYHQQEIYQNNLGEIRSILLQMERLAEQVISNNEVLSSFIPLATDGDKGNYFEKNLIDSIRIGSLLSGINDTHTHVARISVFNDYGDYVSTGTLYETPDALLKTLGSGFFQDIKEKISEKISQSGDGVHITAFHTDTWSSNPHLRLMSLYRPLSFYTNVVYGMVDIQVSADVFADQPFWAAPNQAYTIIDASGELVYPFAQGAQPNMDVPGLLSALAASGQDMVTVEQQWGGQDILVMAARVLPSDWVFVRALPMGELLRPYVNNTALILIASLLLLCCLLVVMYYLSRRIAGPLQSLSQTIAGVNLQNIQQAIETTSMSYTTSELDALSRAFQSMLIRLDRSLSMEIQAHMRALQSQMNPHFLFNMLSVIVESSEESNDKRTVSMCLKLSAMLRYIADYNGDYASLADELQHTRNYLDLMKDRYEDLFEYSIEATGELGSIEVPKMIMQPLAENCFSHGFQDCRPPWRIRIAVAAEQGRWHLRIMDNGSGITEEKIREIHDKVAVYRSDVATNYKNLRLGGMGLVNTLLRLSLSQNESVSFSISQTETGETMIEVGGTYHDTSTDSGG